MCGGECTNKTKHCLIISNCSWKYIMPGIREEADLIQGCAGNLYL